MSGPAFFEGGVAVITGAGLGIGRAAAIEAAKAGMRVAMADVGGDDLAEAAAAARAAGADDRVLATTVDVADMTAVEAFAGKVRDRFGTPDLLMNNAVTCIGRGMWADLEEWRRSVDVNLFGVIHGLRAFAPAMIARGAPARIVNVGSKQEITNPPGHPVYNLAKAAIRNLTEGLAHDLRNSENPDVTAHLLIPGWTTTGHNEHKPGAWLPEEVVAFMAAALERGDFYILCPDGETTPAMDRARVLWAAMDVTENRPALSRWQGDYGDAFKAFEAKET